MINIITPTYPYFQFSKPQQLKDDLMKWVTHFKNRKIPCAIVEDRTRPTKYRFTLWRMGEEHLARNNGQDRGPNTDKIKGAIVKSCLDFKKVALLKAA